MVGRQLSHYRILEKLGQGGMGEVYLAEDTKLDRKVALKLLPDEVAADPARIDRFRQEGRALAALDHPNIVTVYSVEEAEGKHFLTMGLIEGRQLGQEIPADGLPLDRLFEIATPLADALAAAHDKGITHRDLKPANVMLTTEGRVKVLDFGLAKVTVATGSSGATETAIQTREGVVVGTAPYMSPEQVQGKPIDPRSDIFSLGVLLYQMATGKLPFQGDNTASVISAILRDAPEPVSGIRADLPNHLARIVFRCLEKNPERRFQTAKDVRNELELLKREVDSGSYSSASMPAQPQSQPHSQPLSQPQSQPSTPSMETAGAAPARNWWPAAAVVAVVAITAMWFGMRDRPATVPGIAAPTPPPTVTGTGSAASSSEAAADEPDARIVVLPFENLGAAEDEYFAAGMTEEIMSRVGRIEGLGVISRSSAFQYDRSGKTTQQIGEDLGVDYLLEGTVRWAGEGRVRISPQLVRTRDDTSVWSESFDQVIDDVFEVQSQIAGSVADQLGMALVEPQHHAEAPTANPEAYRSYLRGLHYTRDPAYNEETLARALQMYERATRLDPEFALAWARLGIAHSSMHHFGYDRTAERQRQSLAAVERAIALDPDLPEAHLAKGYYHYWAMKDYEPALAEFAIAEPALAGDAEFWAAKSFVVRRQGKWEEAARYQRKAIELSPVDIDARRNLTETYRNRRMYAESIREAEEAIALMPDQVDSYSSLATAHWELDGRRRASPIDPGADARRPVAGLGRDLVRPRDVLGRLRRRPRARRAGSDRPRDLDGVLEADVPLCGAGSRRARRRRRREAVLRGGSRRARRRAPEATRGFSPAREPRYRAGRSRPQGRGDSGGGARRIALPAQQGCPRGNHPADRSRAGLCDDRRAREGAAGARRHARRTVRPLSPDPDDRPAMEAASGGTRLRRAGRPLLRLARAATQLRLDAREGNPGRAHPHHQVVEQVGALPGEVVRRSVASITSSVSSRSFSARNVRGWSSNLAGVAVGIVLGRPGLDRLLDDRLQHAGSSELSIQVETGVAPAVARGTVAGGRGTARCRGRSRSAARTSRCVLPEVSPLRHIRSFASATSTNPRHDAARWFEGLGVRCTPASVPHRYRRPERSVGTRPRLVERDAAEIQAAARSMRPS